jgi:hypothetical protein
MSDLWGHVRTMASRRTACRCARRLLCMTKLIHKCPAQQHIHRRPTRLVCRRSAQAYTSAPCQINLSKVLLTSIGRLGRRSPSSATISTAPCRVERLSTRCGTIRRTSSVSETTACMRRPSCPTSRLVNGRRHCRKSWQSQPQFIIGKGCLCGYALPTSELRSS